MGRERKPYISPQNTESEEGWHDPRTGLRLAPGALQNWPCKKDEDYIKTTHKKLERAERSNSVFTVHENKRV